MKNSPTFHRGIDLNFFLVQNTKLTINLTKTQFFGATMKLFKLFSAMLLALFCSQSMAYTCANYNGSRICAATQTQLQKTKVNGIEVFNPRVANPGLYGTSPYNFNTGKPVTQPLIKGYSYNGAPIYGSYPTNIAPLQRPSVNAQVLNGCSAGQRNISMTPSRPICVR